MLIETLEDRCLCSASHTSFIEGIVAFTVVTELTPVDVREPGIQGSRSDNSALVLQAVPQGGHGQPVAIFVHNGQQNTFVVPGPTPII